MTIDIYEEFIKNQHKRLSEAKQVGVLYHFTSLSSIAKILSLKHQKEQGLSDILQFICRNGYLSLTRNLRMSKESFGSMSRESGMVVRIAFDGDKLSDKYKITPLLGLRSETDIDIFGTNKNRMKRTSGEAEEVLIDPSKSFQLKQYVIEIAVTTYGQEAIDAYHQNIKPQCDTLGIRCVLTRGWEKIKEDVGDSSDIREFILE